MKHVVGYHNTEKMGYSFQEADEHFRFVTKKAVGHLVGAKVWSIVGGDQPRKYFLGNWFFVDDVGPSEQPGFDAYFRGSEGETFEPMIPLNALPWFADFLKSQSNFSLGPSPIRDEFVRHFEALAKQASSAGQVVLRARGVRP